MSEALYLVSRQQVFTFLAFIINFEFAPQGYSQINWHRSQRIEITQLVPLKR